MILHTRKEIEKEISEAFMEIAPSTMKAYAVVRGDVFGESAEALSDHMAWHFRELYRLKPGTSTSKICKLLPDMIQQIERAFYSEIETPKSELKSAFEEFIKNDTRQ